MISPGVQISPRNSISENLRISFRFCPDFADRSYSASGASRSKKHVTHSTGWITCTCRRNYNGIASLEPSAIVHKWCFNALEIPLLGCEPASTEPEKRKSARLFFYNLKTCFNFFWPMTTHAAQISVYIAIIAIIEGLNVIQYRFISSVFFDSVRLAVFSPSILFYSYSKPPFYVFFVLL